MSALIAVVDDEPDIAELFCAGDHGRNVHPALRNDRLTRAP